MKARRLNTEDCPFGGTVLALKKIKEFGIPQVIRATLGRRVKQSKYSYEDVIIAWCMITMCGGRSLDHITKLGKKLSILKGLKLPSHDTLGRVMKALATEVTAKESVKGRGNKLGIHINHYNENEKMNRLLIKASKRIGALQTGRSYTLHIDATFIETNCATSHCDNQGNKFGFNPMICLIDNLPVYVSMRNGDSNAEFQIKECLEQCLNLLAENGIKIHKVISDSAGYNRALIDMLHERNIKFNIHMPFNTYFKKMVKQIDGCENWKETEIKTANHIWQCEVGDIRYKMLNSNYDNRIIIARTPNKELAELNDTAEEKERKELVKGKMLKLAQKKKLKGQGKAYKLGEWKDYKRYKLKLIITNEMNKRGEDLIVEYNKRGNAERQFAAMKKDFAWNLPPFMNMNENTVFLIIAALANNIFRGILGNFVNKVNCLRLNLRLTEFRFLFINVSCGIINNEYVFYNTDIPYEVLM